MTGRLKRTSDEHLMEEIVLRFRSPLIAYFHRRIGDRIEAEDLTQEVFAALTKRARLGSIDNIEGYVFRAGKNLLANRRRTAGSRPSLQFENEIDSFGILVDEITPEDTILWQNQWELFIGTLNELPKRARTIFLLNRFEEMTGREIADRLGLSTSLVEKEMIKSIRYLRERLQ